MIFLMVFSIVGFATQGGIGATSGFNYGEYSFEVRNVEGNQMLFTEVNNQEIGFYSDPNNAQSITFETEAREHLREAQTVYVTINPNEAIDIERQILLRDYQQFANREVIRAYTEEDRFDPLPVITCEDATRDRPVLLVEDDFGNFTNGITKTDDNCYRVQGSGMNIVLARDYLLYNDLGIVR